MMSLISSVRRKFRNFWDRPCILLSLFVSYIF